MTELRSLNVRVSVGPRLFSDLLIQLLATKRRRLSSAFTGAEPQIAIVSGSHAAEVQAPVIIRLPDDDANAGMGTVIRNGASEQVLIASIHGLSRLIDLLAPD